MTTRFSSVAPPAAFFTALLATAPASAGGFGSSRAIDFDTGRSPIRKAVDLDVDRDERRDAAAISGGDVIVLTGPASSSYSSALGFDRARSLCVVDGRGERDDRLAVAHARGLTLASRDASNAEEFEADLDAIGGMGWAEARSLTAIDVDGDGDEDLVGLDSQGLRLLSARQSADGSFQPDGEALLGLELKRLFAAPWGHGLPTVGGIVRSGGQDLILVFTLDGWVVDMLPFAGRVDDVVSIEGPGGQDGLAALVDGSLVVVWAGEGAEAPVEYDWLGPSALGAADLDGDGATDLVLNSTRRAEALSLLQQSGGPSFGPGADFIALDCGHGDMDELRANPVAADFDGDGDVDVLQFVSQASAAYLALAEDVDEEALQPVIADTRWDLFAPVPSVEVDVVLPAMPSGGAPDDLEVVVYGTGEDASAGSDQVLLKVHLEHLVWAGAGETVTVNVAIGAFVGVEASIDVRCYERGGDGSIERAGVEGGSSYGQSEGGSGGVGHSNHELGKSSARSVRRGTPPPIPSARAQH